MKKIFAVLSGFAASAGTAIAAVPTEVTTALSDGKTDAVTVAGLALAIVIGVAAIKYMRRAI